jgi:hypothetical protein
LTVHAGPCRICFKDENLNRDSPLKRGPVRGDCVKTQGFSSLSVGASVQAPAFSLGTRSNRCLFIRGGCAKGVRVGSIHRAAESITGNRKLATGRRLLKNVVASSLHRPGRIGLANRGRGKLSTSIIANSVCMHIEIAEVGEVCVRGRLIPWTVGIAQSEGPADGRMPAPR